MCKHDAFFAWIMAGPYSGGLRFAAAPPTLTVERAWCSHVMPECGLYFC
jgi:hypothetical protein